MLAPHLLTHRRADSLNFNPFPADVKARLTATPERHNRPNSLFCRVNAPSKNRTNVLLAIDWFAGIFFAYRRQATSIRVKHRARLESVSGLTQHALLVDVFAKVLADNLGSLVCQAASEEADLPQRQRTCNRSYAAHLMQRMLPRMVLGMACIFALLAKAVGLLGANTHRRVPVALKLVPKITSNRIPAWLTRGEA